MNKGIKLLELGFSDFNRGVKRCEQMGSSGANKGLSWRDETRKQRVQALLVLAGVWRDYRPFALFARKWRVVA